MKKFLLKNSKTMILFCTSFLLLIFANYLINLYILKSAIQDLQIQMIQSSSNRISHWLESKINAVITTNNFIIDLDPSKDEKDIFDILQKSSNLSGFAGMFVGYENDVTISSRYWDKPFSYKISSRDWYKTTLSNQNITITEPYKDGELETIVVSICVPLKRKTDISGVICGTLPLEYIKTEILDISLPYDGKAFLIDKNNQILVHNDDKQLFNTFAHTIDDAYRLSTNDRKLQNYIFSYGYIEYPQWHFIAQLDKHKVYEKVNFQLFINLLIYGCSLVLFLILNLIYNYHQYKSAEKLTNAQTLIHSFIDHNERGFLVADDQLHITYCNQRFLELLNVPDFQCQEMLLSIDSPLLQNVPLWVRDCIDKMIRATVKKQKRWENEFTITYKGKTTYFFCITTPIVDNQKTYKGLMIILEDITEKEKEKREKQQQVDILFQQSKMADLGEMMGAISHQWRQPLNSISIMLGNLLQFKAMGDLSDVEFEENINHVLTNTHYLSKTIDTFKNFYKPQKNIQSFDIKIAIDDTIFIIEPYFKNTGIVLEIISDDKTYMCTTYRNEFQQIIASLLVNARDALMEKNKKEEKYIKIYIKATENEYHIEIEDTGPGINPYFQSMLFKPFETTKGAKGTGNGLYLSQLIAQQKLQGDITVLSYRNPTVFLLSMLKNIEDVS